MLPTEWLTDKPLAFSFASKKVGNFASLPKTAVLLTSEGAYREPVLKEVGEQARQLEAVLCTPGFVRAPGGGNVWGAKWKRGWRDLKGVAGFGIDFEDLFVEKSFFRMNLCRPLSCQLGPLAFGFGCLVPAFARSASIGTTRTKIPLRNRPEIEKQISKKQSKNQVFLVT